MSNTATLERPVEAKSPVKVIMEFFGLSARQAVDEIKRLTPDDKADLASGINSGTLTY